MASASYKKYKTVRNIKIVLPGLVGLLAIVCISWNMGIALRSDNVVSKACKGSGNVALIKVHGDIVTFKSDLASTAVVASSEEIVDFINQANSVRRIKAIILDIDSYGGSPVAGEEIADALKKSTKPTIALIRGAGDSAAYMVATGAKKIYAGEFSEVGNIGITMSYLDYSEMNWNDGVAYQELSSGEFKDIGNPNKPLTEEERDLLLGYISQLNASLIDMISVNRNLDRNKTVAIADGSIMVADEARTKGLIDEVGGLDDVKNWLRSEFNIRANICSVN